MPNLDWTIVGALATVAAALIAAALALRRFFHWWALRWLLRGDGGAIIALSAESSGGVLVFGPMRGENGSGLRTERRFAQPFGTSERWMLCAYDVDRLHRRGYILRDEGTMHDRVYHLSQVGRQLSAEHTNLLSKGVARARRNYRLRCCSSRWTRCRCTLYHYAVGGREIWLPFIVGRLVEFCYERRLRRSRTA